jgi:putative hemolysin
MGMIWAYVLTCTMAPPVYRYVGCDATNPSHVPITFIFVILSASGQSPQDASPACLTREYTRRHTLCQQNMRANHAECAARQTMRSARRGMSATAVSCCSAKGLTYCGSRRRYCAEMSCETLRGSWCGSFDSDWRPLFFVSPVAKK